MARGKSFTRFAVIAYMPPDVESNQYYQYNEDHNVKAMEYWTQCCQITTNDGANIREQKTPQERANHGIDAEFDKRHLCDTGRERDVGTYHR